MKNTLGDVKKKHIVENCLKSIIILILLVATLRLFYSFIGTNADVFVAFDLILVQAFANIFLVQILLAVRYNFGFTRTRRTFDYQNKLIKFICIALHALCYIAFPLAIVINQLRIL